MNVLKRIAGGTIHLMVAAASKLHYILLVYLASRVAAALIVAHLEGWSAFDGWWWSGVSSLTIGYGDFFPKTVAGRLVADGFQTFWIFYVAPVLIGHMVGLLIKIAEKFTHLEQEWLFLAVTRCYELLRFAVGLLVVMAAKQGVDNMPEVPVFVGVDGNVPPLPAQPSDHDDCEITDEFDNALGVS